MMQDYLLYTLSLARRGGVAVAPNPPVGAVLVHRGRIVSEGWHQHYGGPHAEVHCLAGVTDPAILSESTLYVSLEPCNHHGKTPPCTDLILEKGIPRVVVGCEDPNPQVAGQGIRRLREAGVAVTLAEDPAPFQALIAHFRVNILLQRPYITLKWAKTANAVMGTRSGLLHITGEEALAYGHALRACHQAILVGTETALHDNPALTTRRYPGPSPIRIVLDRRARLPLTLKVFTEADAPIWVLSEASRPAHLPDHVRWLMPPTREVAALAGWLYAEHRVGSILVEGGRSVLQQFVDADCWDAAAVLTNSAMLYQGEQPVPAPRFAPNLMPLTLQNIGTDRLVYFRQR